MKEKSTTKLCKHCKSEIPVKAKVCPVCGKKQGMALWLKILIAFFVIGIIGNVLGVNDSDKKDAPALTSTPVVEASSQPEETETPEVSEEPESTLTTGQKNALKSAKSYLGFSAFSYEGLIDQLEFEGYSNEDAIYAVDNCGADWNEQALKSAKSYLDFSAFSYSGLISQLEYEKFTTEQATYGADNCAADWNEQAAKAAKSYLDTSSFSRDGLIDQLEFEGFTNEQAVYGAEQNGY